MSNYKLMPKVTLNLFFKMQAWGREARFERLIGNSLRYLIPFHLIKKTTKNKELFCHPKSENIFQQLNKYSFLKSLMTDHQKTRLIFCLPRVGGRFLLCAPGITRRRWFYSFVLIGECGRNLQHVYSPVYFFKDSRPVLTSLRSWSPYGWEETVC